MEETKSVFQHLKNQISSCFEIEKIFSIRRWKKSFTLYLKHIFDGTVFCLAHNISVAGRMELGQFIQSQMGVRQIQTLLQKKMSHRRLDFLLDQNFCVRLITDKLLSNARSSSFITRHKMKVFGNLIPQTNLI